jgi:hypothetical protein
MHTQNNDKKSHAAPAMNNSPATHRDEDLTGIRVRRFED